MVEEWEKDASSCPPVSIVGSLGQEHVPETLYGILGALLIRSMDVGAETAQVLSESGIVLPDRRYQVMVLALDDPELLKLDGVRRHNCRIGLYCRIRDRMTQQLRGRADGVLALMYGYLLGLLYPRGAEPCVAEVSRDAVQFAQDTLGVSSHVTVSTPQLGIENIARANTMVQDVESSRKFYEGMVERVFIAPDNILRRLTDKEQQTRFEQGFFTAADRICGTVRAGDVDAVAQELRRELQRIAENCIGMPYPNALNLTVNRFFSLLQYRLMEGDLADWRYLMSLDFSRELISCPTLTEFLSSADGIARRLVAHAKERLDSKHAALMRDIRDYLEANATDINIGLTAVARQFHISPRDAAESFRRFYGVSVNDMVHRARVKRAKELLLTTNTPVQDIASEVGYCSLATMYRAFTNLEGVAPGKLRQNRPNQQKKRKEQSQ